MYILAHPFSNIATHNSFSTALEKANLLYKVGIFSSISIVIHLPLYSIFTEKYLTEFVYFSKNKLNILSGRSAIAANPAKK